LLVTFENFALDTNRRELCRDAEAVPTQPQVFDLLAYLVENRDRVVTKDDLVASIWGGRIVSESTLTSRINSVRRALGDSGKEQRLIRTASRKGIRFVGDVNVVHMPKAPASAVPAVSAVKIPALRQEVRFCRASDGTRIAYAEVGSGPPLIKAANWLTHIEYDWASPVWSHLWRALAQDHRFIRHDQRGCGLSDWQTDDISFAAFCRDLESVIDATGLKRFPLFGISQGCAMSIAYAVKYPERVSHLVLYGGFARGIGRARGPNVAAHVEALSTLMRYGWGLENPAFRQIFTSHFVPGGSAAQVQYFNDLQRMTAPAENAVRVFQAIADIDVMHLLPQVRVPTLVLHCRYDACVPFELGRRMAAGIPGARFVALEGRNHVILESDPCRGRFLDELSTFIRQ
jgi:pimeloyl-ACP methyl ester carboxylesterase/DNA-binding winged helix-turn-helix (wHTH) protein